VAWAEKAARETTRIVQPRTAELGIRNMVPPSDEVGVRLYGEYDHTRIVIVLLGAVNRYVANGPDASTRQPGTACREAAKR
jgi:hypothetical protein